MTRPALKVRASWQGPAMSFQLVHALKDDPDVQEACRVLAAAAALGNCVVVVGVDGCLYTRAADAVQDAMRPFHLTAMRGAQ